MRLSIEEEEKRMQLYEKGLTDREIARKVGRTSVSLFFWRKSRGLLSKNKYKGHPRYDHDAIEYDYKKGLSLLDIHHKYGISMSSASNILTKRGAIRTVSESKLIKTHGWRRLPPMPAGSTRILSLPTQIYEKLGFSRQDELEGKWVVKGGELVLEIRKQQHERVQ